MSKFLDYFAHIFIINLPDRGDRLKAVLTEFQKLGYPTATKDSKVTIFPGLKFTNTDGFPSLGMRGSFSSHLAVIERAREMELQNVLVCEDDLKFIPAPTETIGKILSSIPCQWDIIYFGYLKPFRAPNSHVGLEPYLGGTTGGHLYAVNGSFFDTLIAFMQATRDRPAGHPEGGKMGRDGTFNHLLLVRPETRVFISTPNLATQRSSRSSISPTPILDFWLWSPIIERLRQLKEKFLQ